MVAGGGGGGAGRHDRVDPVGAVEGDADASAWTHPHGEAGRLVAIEGAAHLSALGEGEGRGARRRLVDRHPHGAAGLAERRTWVEGGEDLVGGASGAGQVLCAPLGQAHAMAISGAVEDEHRHLGSGGGEGGQTEQCGGGEARSKGPSHPTVQEHDLVEFGARRLVSCPMGALDPSSDVDSVA